MENKEDQDPNLVTEVENRVDRARNVLKKVGQHIVEQKTWKQATTGAPAMVYTAPGGGSGDDYVVLVGTVHGPLGTCQKDDFCISDSNGRTVNLNRPLADVSATCPNSNTSLHAAPGTQGGAIACNCLDFALRCGVGASLGCKHMMAVNEKRRGQAQIQVRNQSKVQEDLEVAPARQDAASLPESRKREIEGQPGQASQGAAQRPKRYELIPDDKEKKVLPVPDAGFIHLGRNKLCEIINLGIPRAQLQIGAVSGHVQVTNTSKVSTKVRVSPSEDWVQLSPGQSSKVPHGGSVALEMGGPDIYHVGTSSQSPVAGSGAIPEENKTPAVTSTPTIDNCDAKAVVNTGLFAAADVETPELFSSYYSEAGSPGSGPLEECPCTGSQMDDDSFNVQCNPPGNQNIPTPFIDDTPPLANKPGFESPEFDGRESPLLDAPSDDEMGPMDPEERNESVDMIELDEQPQKTSSNVNARPVAIGAALDQNAAAASTSAPATVVNGSQGGDISCSEYMAARASQRKFFGDNEVLALTEMNPKKKGKIKEHMEERPYYAAMIDAATPTLFDNWCPNCGKKGHSCRNSPECSIDVAMALEEWKQVGIAWKEMNPRASFKPKLCNFPDLDWGIACSCAKCTKSY